MQHPPLIPRQLAQLLRLGFKRQFHCSIRGFCKESVVGVEEQGGCLLAVTCVLVEGHEVAIFTFRESVGLEEGFKAFVFGFSRVKNESMIV